ncbi:MAG: hypothetical protein ACJ75B_04695 [Flavisolibacter sp.]
MKWILLLSILALAASKENCKSKKPVLAEGCYKGKLEVKGGCMNYTISMREGNFDTARVVSSWTDDNTGKSYKNVFALGSRCNFPSTINEGDEFYFTLDSTSVQNCMVCMMYYPTPSKHLSIKVLTQPCIQ